MKNRLALFFLAMLALLLVLGGAFGQVPTNPPYTPSALNTQLGQTIYTNGQKRITATTFSPFLSNIVGSYVPLIGFANTGNPSLSVYGFGANGQPLMQTPVISGGVNVTITGAWPNITINSIGPTAAAGGNPGDIQWNNSGALAGFTVSGDGVLDPTTGIFLVSKFNGVPFTVLAGTPPGTGVQAALEANANATGGFPTIPVANAALAHASTTVDGKVCTLGGSCTISYAELSAPAPTATNSVLGLVSPDGTTINNTAGAISVHYGTAANTAAQGNDSRITGALQTSALGANVQAAIGNALGAASGVAGVSSVNSFSGASSHSAAETHAGAETHSGAETHTGQEVFSGTTSNFAQTLANAVEPARISGAAITSPLTYYVNQSTGQSIYFSTTNQVANWTLNLTFSAGTTLDAAMTTGQTATVALCALQGATPYYNNAVQIDGNAVTPYWQGGAAPASGNANGYDCYTYAITKTGAATFIVLASQTQF